MALSFERRCGRRQDPDFLWNWLALTNFMRLSLMKAAHAVVFSAAYRKPGGVITACSYYNSAFYYSRTMAVSGKGSMLISSGDSLRTLSSILSGEGFDEREQRESPFVFSPWPTPIATDFPKNKCAISAISAISPLLAQCASKYLPK